MSYKEIILKIFCSPNEFKVNNKDINLIESYTNFQIVSVKQGSLKSQLKNIAYEDITRQYLIQLEKHTINTFKPRLDKFGVTHPHSAYKGEKNPDKNHHHYLVQFIGPVKQQWLKTIIRNNVKIQSPIHGFTYIVRATCEQINKIIKLPIVHWVGHYRTNDRIFTESSYSTLPRTIFFEDMYLLEFYGQSEYLNGIKKLTTRMIKVKNPKNNTCIIQLEEKSNQSIKTLQRLSKIHGIRSIRNVAQKRISNNVATDIINGNKFTEAPYNLNGAGEVVAICDTGLDTGNPLTIHKDFAERIKTIKSFPITPLYQNFINNFNLNDGPSDKSSGHGTHVSGSAVGDGSLSKNLNLSPKFIRGLAFKSQLVFQAVEQELDWKSFRNERRYGRFLLAGIPDDIRDLFNHAYSQKARIHSNSWGGGAPGEYDKQCWQLDEFVWQKKDFCILVAAGNDGTDRDGDGTINNTSVTAPGTAKNCITVGASENYRPQFNKNKYGDLWPKDYPVAPYKNASMANNKKQIAAFSSRGPTRDGRIKPDVAAPGTYILSTRSRRIAANNFGWGRFPPSNDYLYLGGTSMATPITTGAVACIRQYLRKWIGFENPSAALLKACTIMSCSKLPQYSSNAVLADNQQGFGLLNLGLLLEPSDQKELFYYDDSLGLKTGEIDTYQYRVTTSRSNLKIVLVYSDYPGENLVNNLNLMLIDPDGRRYTGNLNKNSSRILEFDSTNNVEVIDVNRPKIGTWTFQIIAANVPQGPQEYALIINGNVIEL